MKPPAIYESNVIIVLQDQDVPLAAGYGGVKLPNRTVEVVAHAPGLAESDLYGHCGFDCELFLVVFHYDCFNVVRVVCYTTGYVNLSADGNLSAAAFLRFRR